MNETIKIAPPFPINGDGSSLWSDSKGVFHVTKIVVDWDEEDESGTVEMFGKKLGLQYTDDLIAKEVKSLLPLISKYVGKRLKSISWSEQGMQPDKGWNFDIS